MKKTYYPYTTGTPAGTGTEVVYTYGDPKWKDKLTAYNGTNIVSDAIGNTLTDENGVEYEWQGGRELKKMTKPDGTVVSFQYDRNGQRVR